ncbi:MAG: tRNA(Met) cytidine acetyltransferase TmcA [Desulfurococcaceae archaeon]
MVFSNNMIPYSFNRFLQSYGREIGKLISNRFRCLIVLCGRNSVLHGLLAARAVNYYVRKRRVYDKKIVNGLYVYHDEFTDSIQIKEFFEKNVGSKYVNFEYAVYEKSEKYLGMTFSILVMDLTQDLKPNDIGRLIGIVEGGGLIVFLTPSWSEWDNYLTIFKRNLTVPQFPVPRHVFIKWFKQELLEHDGIGIYDIDKQTVIKKFELKRTSSVREKKIVIPQNTLFPKIIYEHALTMDQVNVIKLIELLYEKVRKGSKRVIVITADRGRGKSCAVGIGIVGLINEFKKIKPKTRVLVTAPSSSNVQSLMNLAIKVLDSLNYKYETFRKEGNIVEIRSDRFSIEYWEPINIPRIKGDIVVVDEAAGIPVTMLHKIWSSHNRLVFSTTIHGYEGAGRGFSVRFLQKLKSDKNTQLIEYEMTEPIRYSAEDPIEEWQFKTLLLDAEPSQLFEEDLKNIELKELEYVKYDPEYLFSKQGENELRQLFGIYVLAHYRNEPDDLGMLADAPHHLIRAVKTKTGKIVCAIQLAIEGGISSELANELLKGGRIPGNIIPDRFLKHLRYRDFSKTIGWRIVRIATHPSVQGKGIGSWALTKITEEAIANKLDWLAAGFGINEELLNFWLKNNFIPVHISPDRNPVSGEYTVLVIKPLNKELVKYIEKANIEFRLKMIDSLAINYRDLELGVAYQILSSGKPIINCIDKNIFTPVQLDRLWVYCIGPMTFEAAADIMYRVAKIHWLIPIENRPFNDKLLEYLLIGKALEGKSWEELERELKIPVKELHKYAHKIACIYFEYLTKIKPEEYEPGVSNLDYDFKIYL